MANGLQSTEPVSDQADGLALIALRSANGLAPSALRTGPSVAAIEVSAESSKSGAPLGDHQPIDVI